MTSCNAKQYGNNKRKQREQKENQPTNSKQDGNNKENLSYAHSLLLKRWKTGQEQSDTRERNSPEARSICDALQAESPGEMTFAINRQLLGKGLTVTDDEVRQAIRFSFRHLKLVVEPGGAVALAAVLTGKIDTRDKVTVAVLSGGNVDANLFAEILSESAKNT